MNEIAPRLAAHLFDRPLIHCLQSVAGLTGARP
jgi:hypothetical protein